MARHLHIDPFSGIAGDMLLAGLVHLGAPRAPILEVLARVSFPGLRSFTLSFPAVDQCGVPGLGLRVDVEAGGLPPSASYPELVRAIASAEAPSRVEERALATLATMADAEAKIRGISREEVRFRGLGGLDTVVDLLGSLMGVECLAVSSVSCGPLPLGRGETRCDEGTRPAGAPATLELLTGLPTVGVDLGVELVTSTGAALARNLSASFGPPPAMTLRGTAAGFGTTALPGRANCLRLLLGEREAASTRHEWLRLLETNLDDLPAEILSTLPDTCLAAGALDAWLTPVLMKKGRPAQVLSALCSEDLAPRVEEAIFRHSSTLGVRSRAVERRSLERTWEEVHTPWGPVRVKVGLMGQEVLNRAPEFEDCRRLAERAGVTLKEVYAAALGACAR
jgi:uncharacterized protein (TIGR00299 family) protein